MENFYKQLDPLPSSETQAPEKEYEIGSVEWFKNRMDALIESCEPNENREWDFSDPALIWWHPKVGDAYENLQKRTRYKKLVTDAEHRLIQDIAPAVVSALPKQFSFIDLGPGTEQKEQYFLNAIQAEGKQIVYRPVDVNNQMLGQCIKSVVDRKFTVLPIHAAFETVDVKLQEINDYKFVSLGMTFLNYSWTDGLQLLDNIMNHHGAAFITVQLRERIDIEEYKRLYSSPQHIQIMHPKLELMGFDIDQDISHFVCSDDINLYAVLKNVPVSLQNKGFQVGDKIQVGKTRRPSMEELKEQLDDRYDYQIHDTGETFVGVVIKPIP